MERACLTAYHEYLLSVVLENGIEITGISKHI